jgi:sugar O-acyltransferase (sialic acid O-acetyltransferase NeuD family)
MAILYAIYGASGHGRETMPHARAAAGNTAECVFVDDAPAAAMVNGHRVLTYEQFLAEPASQKHVSIAIGDSRLREQLATRCRNNGLAFFSVQASNAVVGDEVTIGEGAILSAFVLLTANIRVGRQFHANMHTSVAHDCVIGDFVTLAPGVRCNGNVTIEDHAYIGSGAILRNGAPGRPIVIGRGAVVGMGAVVTRSVAPGVTVAGNPARPMERSE